MPDGKLSGLPEQRGNVPCQILLSFDDLGTYAQIFDTSVVAGAKECFVDLDSTCFFCRNNIVYKIGFATTGRTLLRSKVYSLTYCIRITVEYSFWLTSMFFEVFHGFFVCFKDTGLCTCLYCHVAESHTVTDA